MATTVNKDLFKDIVKAATEINKELDAQAMEKLTTARIAMLLRLPFYGNIITRLHLKNADMWCPTLATDGKHLYYNSKFVMELTPGELVFGLAHEVLHVVYDTLGRNESGSRDHRLWNIASDFTINRDLKEAKVGEFITTIEICYDPAYKGKSSEEIYEILLDQLKQNAKMKQNKSKGGSGGADGGAGDSGDSGDGDADGSANADSSSGGACVDPKNMTDEEINDALDGMLDKLLDEHLDDKDDANGNGGNKNGGDGDTGPVPMTAEERRELRDELKEAILNAAEQAQAAGAGNLPGGVQRLIDKLVDSKIDWRDLLKQQIESIIKNDFSWSRPSRKNWHTGAVLPGMIPGETIEVAIAIDTSGSISKAMLIDFMSEVKGIMEQYDEYKIDVWCFDTEIHNHVVFSLDSATELEEYEPAGFGGTDFMANWEYMMQNDIEPKRLIVFTDGYPFGSWGIESYCDTVWIIHGDDTIVPPFGIHAYYSRDEVKFSNE